MLQAEILSDYKVYMRYTGQGWEIPVTLSEGQAMNPDVATFQRLFEEDYAKLFGRTVEGLDVEITVWAANATTPPEEVAKVQQRAGGGAATHEAEREIFDPALDKPVTASVVLRNAIDAGQTVEGPAAITEDETTIIMPTSQRAVCQPDGCIDIVTKAAEVRRHD